MITDENIERVNKIDSVFIRHSRMDIAIINIELAIRLSKTAKEPVNILLTGPAGSGKTTTCNAIVSKRNRKFVVKDGCDVTLVPAFYTLVPDPVTIKGIASAMLESIGAPSPTKGSTIDLTYRLGRLLKECETEVIILDELQHLLKIDHDKNNNVKDWLKSLINLFKVPIVVVGTPECDIIISNNKQLARRFKKQFSLGNFYYDVNKKGEFRKFIEALSMAYIKVVKLSKFPEFKTEKEFLPLFAATGGNPADISELFRWAAIFALEVKQEQVSLKHFSEAYNSLIIPNSLTQVTVNPFELSTKKLHTLLSNGRKAS